jgi:hypothetical protein
MAVERQSIARKVPALYPPLMLTAGCLGLMMPAMGADVDNQLEVGVRSVVLAQPAAAAGKSDLQKVAEQRRIYGILAVQPIDSDELLVKPVDARKLMALVSHGLDTHGFLQVEKGQKPEIIITVQYGRGWLANPYLSDARNAQTGFEHLNFVAVTGDWQEAPAVQDLVGVTEQFMDERAPGHEAKLQKAALEKLYILVLAWRYPTDPNAKATILWKTTMVADDPDHQDLNVIAAQMIAAGAPFFAKEIKQGEIDVTTSPPEGHVKVGTPKVVEPASPLAERERPNPAAVANVPRKQFDIPDGDAALTLKAFSRQSGVEIIYPAEEVRAIKTHGVKGELSAHAALARMLDGTRLITAQDEKTGAFAVRLAEER